MQLTFDFKTVEEAQEFLKGLTRGRQPEVAPTQELPAAPVGPSKNSYGESPVKVGLEAAQHIQVLADKVPETEKKKRGPKPKTAPEPTKVYGLEDCRTALSALFDAKGRDAAKAALAEFKVVRIGELKADQYRGFIVLCETLSQPE